MRKIIASTYVTLDGFMDDPQLWSMEYFDDAALAFMSKLVERSDALLMGRKTYEGFAEAWPEREGEPGDTFNAMPKHVASRTRSGALEWNNSHVLEGDLVEAVRALKEQPGDDILMFGTGPVAHALIEAGLLDEHITWVHPVIWGAPGQRLFDAGLPRTKLELADTTVLPSGIVILTHRPATA